MFRTAFSSLHQRVQARRALGRLLARDDTHLLDDIGLTRHDVARLIDGAEGHSAAPDLRMVTAGGLRLRAV